jgi:ribosomal protein L27
MPASARWARPHATTRSRPSSPSCCSRAVGSAKRFRSSGPKWDLKALDHEGRKVGEIHLTGAGTKTHKARTVGLEVSPALRAMLAALHLRSGGKGSVFGLSKGAVDAAAKRLRGEYGAPDTFTWQALCRTCGTYLTNAPGILGAASAYRSAKQLGHSVQVAERHYLGPRAGHPSGSAHA